eukprot:6215827-Pyramimonas_sp.AAC.1
MWARQVGCQVELRPFLKPKEKSEEEAEADKEAGRVDPPRPPEVGVAVLVASEAVVDAHLMMSRVGLHPA